MYVVQGVDPVNAQINSKFNTTTSPLITEIKNLKLSTFTVEDMDASQTTNIVHVKINGKGDITSRKVTERLALVSQSETSCKTADGLGIVVLASAKPDSKTVRFVLHHDVNDYDLKHAVKKIQLVLTEIDKNK